jgi:Raf kinase inhibitor-like YbhB/YbcL family protein
MHRQTFRTIAFMAGGLLMAHAALALELTSPAFKQGEKIPSKYTCDAQGGGVNPALNFGAVPANTKQLVLTMHDPDVPKNLRPDGNFDHWFVWDIAPTSKGIAEGAGAQMGMNGTGKAGYIGPCPPDREHRYFFRLYALDAPITGKTFKDRAELEAAMKGHILAQSELMGRYEKIKK